ncbi:hypothetical protein ACFV94_31515 [Streptomyces sp. NPDC059896]
MDPAIYEIPLTGLVALMTVLVLVALAHPDPFVRQRALVIIHAMRGGRR